MYPVMGRRDEDIFEPAHFTDQFRMYKDPPNLGRGVYQDDIQRLETQQGQRYEIDEAIKWLEHGRAEPDGEIHLVGRVVRDVHRPEKPDLVVPAMEPVVEEILGEQQQEPIRENIGDGDPVVEITELQDDQVDAAEQQIDGAVQDHQVKIGDGVPDRIAFPMPVIAQQDFQADDDQI